MRFSTSILAAAATSVLLLCGCVEDDPDRDDRARREPVSVEAKLALDKTNVKVGDQVTFTTTLTNTGGSPVNLYVGYSHSGNGFDNGSLLRAYHSDAKLVAKKLIEPQWCVGFCGTGSYPMFVTLAPGKSQEFKVSGEIKSDEKGVHLRCGFVRLPLVKQGRHTFYVAHEVEPKSQNTYVGYWKEKQNRPEDGMRPDLKAAFWSGKITTNEVTLQLEPSKD